ncbi:alpha/beta fold hydrolase [Thalassotalea euphylliae]|uniref:Alpha/beta hydrolase n=1 Tax=Thalassotalea euphylliae TaxID=1655234 RepID=A0A3E0UKG2_9GAMM|nr:alpha/beta hydrolase [Thalassotalea euphylliae]REL37346.1 alpha/beta hydrolase [Thalassotalea euphylliae]
MTQALLNTAIANFSSTASTSTTAKDMFTPSYAMIGKHKVRYAQSIKANAPNLVLLNGFPQSIRMWESAWSELAKHFNLLAFDIPGFGLSSADKTDMSPRALSAKIIEVFDYFNIDKAHLVGPDVGVPITLATAIDYPERLVSINIFDGPGSNPPAMSPILKAVINYRLVRWLAAGLNKKAIMKTNFNAAVKDGYHHYQPNERAIKEYYEITHNEQAHQNSIAFFGSYQRDLPWIEENLTKIQTPTLITWGKHDPFVLASNAEYLSSQLPNNKVKIFENASHFSAEDAGDEYVELIKDWCLGEHQLK